MGITKELIRIFADWTKLKIRIHVSESEKEVYFKEGQVWWASVGQNIGVESNGKNDSFERPVIILKKFNKDSFLGVMLYSKSKQRDHYIKLQDIKGASNIANISQIKTMSSKRLLRKISDTLSSQDMNLILEKVIDYLEKAKPPFGGISELSN